MSDISNRSAARAAGLRHYEGSPCASHPGALRYVASKACVECAKAARRRNVDTEKDKLRKRAARARAAGAAVPQSSIFCDLVGL